MANTMAGVLTLTLIQGAIGAQVVPVQGAIGAQVATGTTSATWQRTHPATGTTSATWSPTWTRNHPGAQVATGTTTVGLAAPKYLSARGFPECFATEVSSGGQNSHCLPKNRQPSKDCTVEVYSELKENIADLELPICRQVVPVQGAIGAQVATGTTSATWSPTWTRNHPGAQVATGTTSKTHAPKYLSARGFPECFATEVSSGGQNSHCLPKKRQPSKDCTIEVYRELKENIADLELPICSRKKTPVLCACPRNHKPVCVAGKTYPNICSARCALQRRKFKSTRGECGGVPDGVNVDPIERKTIDFIDEPQAPVLGRQPARVQAQP